MHFAITAPPTPVLTLITLAQPLQSSGSSGPAGHCVTVQEENTEWEARLNNPNTRVTQVLQPQQNTNQQTKEPLVVYLAKILPVGITGFLPFNYAP